MNNNEKALALAKEVINKGESFMSQFNIISATSESTVVAEYTPDACRSDSYQSEAALEQEFLRLLCAQGYEYLEIHDEAALIEPLTIALAAAEQAHISYGKSVAIMGAGGIGLMLVQLARLAGASCVTVFDLVEEKCELAKQLGADYAFDPRKEGALEEAMKVAGGAYDCVLEGTGVVSSAENALKLLARNGDGVYFAMYGKDPYLQVNLHTDFYWDQKHLHGVIMGAGLFPKAIKLAPRVNLKALIQKEHPLSRYQDAFADLYTKKYAKIVIKMDE